MEVETQFPSPLWPQGTAADMYHLPGDCLTPRLQVILEGKGSHLLPSFPLLNCATVQKRGHDLVAGGRTSGDYGAPALEWELGLSFTC